MQQCTSLPPSWTAPSAPALVATPCSTVTSSSGGGGGGGGGSGSSTPPRARRRRNPMADSAAVITIGGAMRLTVLTESVVRIEHRGYGVRPAPFDDRATFAIVNRRLKVPHFRAELGTCELLRGKSSRCLVVQTARLRLEHAAPQNATQLRVGNGGRGEDRTTRVGLQIGLLRRSAARRFECACGCSRGRAAART